MMAPERHTNESSGSSPNNDRDARSLHADRGGLATASVAVESGPHQGPQPNLSNLNHKGDAYTIPPQLINKPWTPGAARNLRARQHSEAVPPKESIYPPYASDYAMTSITNSQRSHRLKDDKQRSLMLGDSTQAIQVAPNFGAASQIMQTKFSAASALPSSNAASGGSSDARSHRVLADTYAQHTPSGWVGNAYELRSSPNYGNYKVSERDGTIYEGSLPQGAPEQHFIKPFSDQVGPSRPNIFRSRVKAANTFGNRVSSTNHNSHGTGSAAYAPTSYDLVHSSERTRDFSSHQVFGIQTKQISMRDEGRLDDLHVIPAHYGRSSISPNLQQQVFITHNNRAARSLSPDSTGSSAVEEASDSPRSSVATYSAQFRVKSQEQSIFSSEDDARGAYMEGLLRCRIEGCPRLAKKDSVCLFHHKSLYQSLNGSASGMSLSGTENSVPSKKAPKRATVATTCQLPGCTRRARRRGLCYAHGRRQLCRVEGCDRSMRRNGVCFRHGGGVRCVHRDGCRSAAVSNGLCKRHGGGRRCSMPGCTVGAESRGLCYAHGGGKRCLLPSCTSKSRRGGYCLEHYSSALTSQQGRRQQRQQPKDQGSGDDVQPASSVVPLTRK